MNRSASWFDRQLAHARQALVEAERQHTPEEVAAAMAALAVGPGEPQAALTLPLEASHA